jgi:hypothetical protein
VRPLPDLSPLPPLGDVYDPTNDDFTKLLSDQTDTFDSLQSALDPGVDQTLSDAQAVSDALDAALSVYDGIDGTFAQLNMTTNDLEIAQEEANAIGIEMAFAEELDAFNPDLFGAAATLLGEILTLFNNFYNDFVRPIFNQVFGGGGGLPGIPIPIGIGAGPA